MGKKSPTFATVGIMLAAGMFLGVAGCSTCPLTEGAYVGGENCAATAPGGPQRQSSSTVPIFASRNVRDDARNRAAIERYTGRPVFARPVTTDDVLAWHQAGAQSANIITHIRTHGMSRPLNSQDELTLNNRGVATDVIRAMHEHPYPKTNAPVPPPRVSATSPARSRTTVAPPSGNPNTNPGSNAVTFGGTRSGSTTAQPVRGSGTGKTRLREAPLAPAYGSELGGLSGPEGLDGLPPGAVVIDDGSGGYFMEGGYIIDQGCCY